MLCYNCNQSCLSFYTKQSCLSILTIIITLIITIIIKNNNNNNDNDNNNKLRFVWHEIVHKLAKAPSFVYCLKENG